MNFKGFFSRESALKFVLILMHARVCVREITGKMAVRYLLLYWLPY